MSELQEALSTIKVMNEKISSIKTTVESFNKDLNDSETGLKQKQAKQGEAIKWLRGHLSAVTVALISVVGWVIFISVGRV